LFILSWAAKSAVSIGPSLATLKESLDRIALVFLSTGQSGVLHLLKEWNAFRHCSLPPKQPNSPTLSETAPEPVTTASPLSISISNSISNKEEKEEEEEEEEENTSSTFVSNDDYLGWESVELSADVRIHCERTLEDALQDSCIMSAALLMGPRLIAGFPSWHEDQIPPSSSSAGTTSTGNGAHSESVGSVSFNPLRSRSSNHAARGAKEGSTPSLAASSSAPRLSPPIRAPLLTHRTDGSFPAIAGMWRQICAFTQPQEQENSSSSSPVSKSGTQSGTQSGSQSQSQSPEHSANPLSVHSQEECDPADGNASWYSSNESQHTESFHDFSNDTAAEKEKVKDKDRESVSVSVSASDNDPSAMMENLDLHPVGSFYLPAETSGMSQFREHVRANLNGSFESSGVRTPPDTEALEKEEEEEKDQDDTDDTDRDIGGENDHDHDHGSSASPSAMPAMPLSQPAESSCQCLWHVAGRSGYIIALPASFAPGWIYAILKSDSSLQAIQAMETLRESLCATLSDVLAYVCVRSQTHLRIRDFALHIPGLFWFVLVDRLTARLVIPTGDNSLLLQRQMITRLNAYRLNLKHSSARFTLQRDSTCSLSSSIWQEDNDHLSSSSSSQEAASAASAAATAATVAYPFSPTHPSATNSIRYELHLALHPSMGYAAVLVMHGKLWELLKDYRESSPG
jgi:hypothetical protein